MRSHHLKLQVGVQKIVGSTDVSWRFLWTRLYALTRLNLFFVQHTKISRFVKIFGQRRLKIVFSKMVHGDKSIARNFQSDLVFWLRGRAVPIRKNFFL